MAAFIFQRDAAGQVFENIRSSGSNCARFARFHFSDLQVSLKQKFSGTTSLVPVLITNDAGMARHSVQLMYRENSTQANDAVGIWTVARGTRGGRSRQVAFRTTMRDTAGIGG